MMSDDQFWTLLQSNRPRGGDQDDHLDALRAALDALDAEAVAGFAQRFRKAMADSFAWELWGAAYVMNGGCSDDGFDYFRPWLIAQGREVFELGLRDPDGLAAYDFDDEFEFESLLYLPDEVYEAKTGKELVVEGQPLEPSGQPWDEDDLERLYPKLCARYS